MTKTDRLEQLFMYLKQSPGDSFLQYCIALEYIKKEDFTNALYYFKQIIEQNPNYTGTYYHLGKLYERLQDKDNALEIYQKGLEITRKLQENHAYSELMNAKNELLNDFDVEFDD